MHALRKQKLRDLLERVYKGERGRFLKESRLSKGRVTQLLDPKEPFGDVAARNLEGRLKLPVGYFDSMDARTVRWATAFEALPDNVKAQWEQLTAMLGKPPPQP
jgi:hypothetical protein